MKTTKHLAVTALLVLGLTLPAVTSARAEPRNNPPGYAEAQLICQVNNTDPDFGATGDLVMDKLKFIIFDPAYGSAWRCNLTLVCTGLTPGATYWTNWGTFTVGPDGSGGIKKNRANIIFVLVYGDGPYPAWFPDAPVYRLNSDGTRTLVLNSY